MAIIIETVTYTKDICEEIVEDKRYFNTMKFIGVSI